MRPLLLTALSSMIILLSCEKDNEHAFNTLGNRSADGDWLIPAEEVRDGGPGKDGIPALESPQFVPVSDPGNEYLSDDDLVLGIQTGDVVRAYPHPVLDWHEIVNDQVGDDHFSVTYCPLTGTGIAWNRAINGEVTTFGVSGLLYNSNLIPYDRKTDSYWSQMRLDCVNGELIGETLETKQLVELTWKDWKGLFPGSEVVSVNTGYTRSYGTYPYGSYRTGNSLIFPAVPEDDRLHKKERVHGIIINGKVKVYRFDDFGDELTLIKDNFEGKDIIIAGIRDRFIVSFYPELEDGTPVDLSGRTGELPIIMSGENCGMWNLFGHAVDGPLQGQRLRATESYMGYWFAWAAFYPEPEINTP